MHYDSIIRDLGVIDYQTALSHMQSFTDERNEHTIDEIWLLEHPPVFTQGLAGKPEHILNPHHIPIVQTDRGGQVTYHGPGQLVIYPLIDVKRKSLYARRLVTLLENSVISTLSHFGIESHARCDAPGVYVKEAKICSIGLRVRKGASYHGIALNVAMDLTPFSYINPCGYQGLVMTQIKSFVPSVSIEDVKRQILPALLANFGYNQPKLSS